MAILIVESLFISQQNLVEAESCYEPFRKSILNDLTNRFKMAAKKLYYLNNFLQL